MPLIRLVKLSDFHWYFSDCYSILHNILRTFSLNLKRTCSQKCQTGQVEWNKNIKIPRKKTLNIVSSCISVFSFHYIINFGVFQKI